MATLSTTPPTRPERSPDHPETTGSIPAGQRGSVTLDTGKAQAPPKRSLATRMMAIALGWILILLLAGGFVLDRTLTRLIENNFDDQLEYNLRALVASAEISEAGGEVYLIRQLGDQRFLEPDSGLYWQITASGDDEEAAFLSLPSRSLWDRSLGLMEDASDDAVKIYDSDQFRDDDLRIAERTTTLPFSDRRWTFAVAASREELDLQLGRIRTILIVSFAVLGIGLMVLAFLQNFFGLRPLRRVRAAIQNMRSAGSNRIDEPLPLEVQPLVEELNGLLAHSERQAEEARMHAGNLAHALKTPLTVLTNAATAHDPKLSDLVCRETKTMQRHVEHHLARARAVGRRATGLARADVWPSVESVLRAVTRIYENTRFDLDGNEGAIVSIERQDLDEILGNLIENAAKYGGGSVFVTVDAEPDDPVDCTIWVEDDGMGIPSVERPRIFDRGARLDTGKPGTGLGLAIVRDVAEIYGGSVNLSESDDLGGLLVSLKLPRAA